MLVARITDGNPYRRSVINTGANSYDRPLSCEGVFVFLLGEPVMHPCTGDPDEPLTLDYLSSQFGELGDSVHVIDIDDDEVFSKGYGRYAEPRFIDWHDTCLLPEAYVVFKED